MNNYEPIFEKPIGWTSIEQAKKLVAAGLVPNTADMYYYAVQKFDGNEYVNTVKNTKGEVTELLNKWAKTWAIKNFFINIVDSGSCFIIFYDSRLDEES